MVLLGRITMNTYLIEHRISTLAKLWKPFTFHDFTFRQWHVAQGNGPAGNAWIARATVQCRTAQEAIDTFRAGLLTIVDKIVFVSQCATSADYESFFLQRQNENAEGIFFFRSYRNRRAVTLDFRQEEQESLAALDAYSPKGDVFRYLREAANAATYYARFVMLLSALEAIAGQIVKRRGLTTNKDYIQAEVLADSTLFEKLFKHGAGVRNLLLHGSNVDLATPEHRDYNYAAVIHGKIAAYFNRKHGTQINMAVRNAPRNPIGNFEILGLWLKPVQQGPLELRLMIEEFAAEQQKTSNKFWEWFADAGMPTSY